MTGDFHHYAADEIIRDGNSIHIRAIHPGDTERLIMRISLLVEIVPELRELDLNPVKVRASGKGAIVVDRRMRVGPLSPEVSR